MSRPPPGKAQTGKFSSMSVRTAYFPRLSPWAMTIVLGGCATYAPHPLDLSATGAPSLDALHHSAPLPDRLAPEDVARLALDNNPDLVAARAQRGVARAQREAAGILPNPVLGLSYADVLSGAGTIPALAASLSQDLKGIVTLSAKRGAAKASEQSIDASVLWQEWQTINKAQLAAVDVIAGERQLALLRANAALWSERVTMDHRALESGDATLVTLAPDIAAAADAQKQLDDAERAQATRRRDLNGLIGLAPTVPLRLAETMALPEVDADHVRAQLADLPNRRPDLIALQLGYRSQEEKVRGAVLAQFPALSIGPAYSRDTSNVKTLGPQISMDLPVFDRNQGNLSQEQATREQLRAEFEARVMAARAEVESLLADHAELQRQRTAKRALLAQLDEVPMRSSNALAAGDIDERTYVDLATARNAKQQDVLALELLLDEQRVALSALIGDGMPPAEMPSPEGSP